MKNLLFIFTLAVGLISCEKEEALTLKYCDCERFDERTHIDSGSAQRSNYEYFKVATLSNEDCSIHDENGINMGDVLGYNLTRNKIECK